LREREGPVAQRREGEGLLLLLLLRLKEEEEDPHPALSRKREREKKRALLRCKSYSRCQRARRAERLGARPI
jgi:hypothetical protein